jgi:short-subunit dehydrogenase
MARDLQGIRVLLTGASRGIGRCLALQLAPMRVQMTLAARSEVALNAVVDEAKSKGATAHAAVTDVTSDVERKSLIRRAVESMGGLDVLINNAGVASFGHFDSSSEDVLRKVMEVNFFAPAEMMRLAAPHLMKGNRPAIINVASICGRVGLPGWTEHCASKFGIVGLSEALRGEYSRFDIDVLVVMPGLVRSDDLGRHLLRNEGRMKLNFAGAQPPEEVAVIIIRSLQRNRAETAIGWQARWLRRAQRFVPRFVDRMLARKVRQLYPEVSVARSP